MTAVKAKSLEARWRYLKFSRFVWLLQKRQLWLSRADLLGDPWYAPITTLPLPKVKPETAMERAKRIIPLWLRQLFVNCWSNADHEPHALWRVYCALPKALQSKQPYPSYKRLLVKYRSSGQLRDTGGRKQTPAHLDLVTKKRPVFAYVQEVRIVLSTENKKADPETEVRGKALDWNPEENVESIRVHPEADAAFMETVKAIVRDYAPALKDSVAWSDVNAAPPF